MHWITSPVREKPSESADSTMACFNRNGALPLMSREIGGDNGSDIYGATANVEPESDASNLA